MPSLLDQSNRATAHMYIKQTQNGLVVSRLQALHHKMETIRVLHEIAKIHGRPEESVDIKLTDADLQLLRRSVTDMLPSDDDDERQMFFFAKIVVTFLNFFKTSR